METEERVDPIDLRSPEIATEIMLVLLQSGRLRWNELMKAVDTEMNESSVDASLRELVRRGYVHRIEKSRRNVQYALSDEGRNFIRRNRQKHRQYMVELLSSEDRAPIDVAAEILVSWVISHHFDKVALGRQKGEDVRALIRDQFVTEIETSIEAIQRSLNLVNELSGVVRQPPQVAGK